MIDTLAPLIARFDVRNATRWPAVPLKVDRAFCPGVVVVTVVAVPFATSVPVTSGGTSYSVRVTPPVYVKEGSNRIVYVPVRDKVCVSMLA